MPTELEKLNAAGETYGDLIEFLDWIDSHADLALAEWLRVDDDGKPRVEPRLVPRSRSAQSLIYEFLGIDADALERERRTLLTNLREEP